VDRFDRRSRAQGSRIGFRLFPTPDPPAGGVVVLRFHQRRRPARPLKPLPLLLHPLQFALPTCHFALRRQERRALGQRDQLSQLALFKTRALNAVLKGVELAAQKLLSRYPRDIPFKFRVRHKP
jgi:hypothetical protein